MSSAARYRWARNLLRAAFIAAVAAMVCCAAAQRPRTDKAAVVFNRSELFYLYSRVGSFGPEDRAKLVSERIAALADDRSVEVTIPNSTVLAGHIVNYSANAREDGLVLHTTVTIGYDAPWRRVHELLIEAAKKTPNIKDRPAPYVLQTSLDDNYVSYELNAYTDQPNRMATIYSMLHQQIQDTFNEAGVEIMSPRYTALRDGNETTIPVANRPEDYRAPAFRVEQTGADGDRT